MTDEIKIDVELLKKDVSMISNLCGKFDTTIDKMQEIASNLSRMVSLQEQRIEVQEKITQEVQSVLEKRRLEHVEDTKELHSRITTVNRELTQKIEESEKRILAELHSMREDLRQEENTFGQKLAGIESWKYMMVGGLMVITWVLARLDISKLLILLSSK
jgi:dsDNA-specific endonuclease/ATPase MutS2